MDFYKNKNMEILRDLPKNMKGVIHGKQFSLETCDG